MRLAIDQIKPSPYQPRIAFELEDIRGSIQKDGILVPITVRKRNGYYELIDGERRTRLAKDLGYNEIPATVIDVDDSIARRMVWKVNTLRKDYSPKEKAYHFKKLQEQEGMSLRGIARECDYDYHSVLSYLNILSLPEKYRNFVWDGKISVSHIRELEPYFNGEVSASVIVSKLDVVLEQKLTSTELRQAIRPELEEIEKRRVESAKKAVGKITSEVKEPQTPEELEKAAQVLKREAKKKREESLTPEEKAKQEAEKQWKKEERKRKREEKKRKEEEKQEQIRKHAQEEARLKLLQNKEFLQQASTLAAQTLNEEQSEEDTSPNDESTTSELSDKEDEFSPDFKGPYTNIDAWLNNYSKTLKNIDPKHFKSNGILQKSAQYAIIKTILKENKFSCPICGNTKIVRECGHDI